MEKATATEIAALIVAVDGTVHGQTAMNMLKELNMLLLNQANLERTLKALITAAKSMPEHPYTPAQMALDDAVEAAEKVVGEVAG